MKNKALLFIAVVATAVSLLSGGCTKEDNNSTTTFADTYTGNWFALDTVYNANGSIATSGQIYFSITKKDANNIYLESFLLDGDTVVFSANATTLAYVSGGGSYTDFYSGLVFTLGSNKLYYTRNTGTGYNTGIATRQ